MFFRIMDVASNTKFGWSSNAIRLVFSFLFFNVFFFVLLFFIVMYVHCPRGAEHLVILIHICELLLFMVTKLGSNSNVDKKYFILKHT